MIANVPHGSQLVLVGRSQPSAELRLARLRLDDSLAEFGPADLALDASEAEWLWAREGVATDEAAMIEIIRRTEGWAAGVHLAALALEQGPGGVDGSPPLTGAHRVVADFFAEEVLRDLPDDVVSFLEQSSVLDEMTATALDEILETTTSARMLHELEGRGDLFLEPVDAASRRYRYGHLFAETLRARLEVRDPYRGRDLHRRASSVLERHGDDDGAVRHAIAAGDVDRAARLILSRTPPLVFGGDVEQLREWLELIGRPAVPQSPAAALAWAWYGLATGDVRLVNDSVTEALKASGTPTSDPVPSEVEAAVAMIKAMIAADGLAGVARDCAVVRAAGRPETNPWWGLATLIEGTVSSMLGENALARGHFERVLLGTGTAPAIEACALAHLAIIDLREGHDHDAERQVADALAIAEHHQLDRVLPAVAVYAVGALVAARAKRPEAARRAITTATEMLDGLNGLSPRTSLLCNLLMAEAELAIGERSGARARVAEAERARLRDPSATFLVAELERVLAQLDRGRDTAFGRDSLLTPAEARVLVLLPTHRSLLEIAEELFISRNTAKSQAISIYRKLGVTSRSDAVEKARRIGLLPE